MSETQSQGGEDFGEDAFQEVPLPYFWQLIQNVGENIEEQVLESLKLAKVSSEDGDEEEAEEEDGEDGAAKTVKVPTFAAALNEIHPETKMTLLQWATQEGYARIVELLTSKAQEANLVRDLISVDETERKIFERWEQEYERLRKVEEKLALKAQNPDAEEEEEPEEEEEGEEKLDFHIKLSREFGVESEPQGEDEEPQLIPFEVKKILEIGELGIYNGSYRQVSEEQLREEEDEDEENRPLHPYKFIREGEGQVLFRNGDIYVGGFENGEKSGLGTYIYASKAPKPVVKEEDDEEGEDEKKVEETDVTAKHLAWYTGQWQNGMKHGSGVFYYPDGSKYVGEFQNNLRHGTGTFTYPNGDSFSGSWKENKKDGEGTYHFADDKSQYVGTFNNGVFNEGQWRLANGTTYEGQYGNNGQPQGRGVMLFHSIGVKQAGVFKNGRWYGQDKLVRA